MRIVLGVSRSSGRPCSGHEMMFQAFVVELLAFLVFPMPNGLLRLPLLLLTPLPSRFANGLGVALLVLIASMDPFYSVEGTGTFGFFHLGEASIAFSSLG
jgi:hypothetical protein